MPTVIADDLNLEIPEWVTDLAAFRRWTDATDFPDNGNVWWLRGQVWADMSKEQLFTHNHVRTRITTALDNLVYELDLGWFFSDGALVTNALAGLSGNPDGTFVSHEALDQGRAVLIQGKSGGLTEIEGSPDMALEVVSESSVVKDLTLLREDYFVAGIREYWLVDVRQDPMTFDVLRRNSKGFVATRKVGGWVKSQVFGKSFRLTRSKNQRGQVRFQLDVK
jgi:Uma2 family endonuclease